jgi:hypothetical protein
MYKNGIVFIREKDSLPSTMVRNEFNIEKYEKLHEKKGWKSGCVKSEKCGR